MSTMINASLLVTGILEDAWTLSTSNLVSLSEQQLVNCESTC